MNISNIISIIGNILQFVSITVAIIQLLTSKKNNSKSLSVFLNNYNLSTTNNEIIREEHFYKENTESQPLIFLVILFVIIASIAFHSIISTLLSFLAAIYLFKTIYFARKNQLSFNLSCLIIGQAIAFNIISLSTFYFTPELVKIANSFPTCHNFNKGFPI